MVKLTTEVKESLAGTKLVFLATAAKDGMPNVVPIGAFKLLDDETILISDQFFKKTLSNMKANPKVAFSWWGEKGGFQIKGTVTLHTDGKIFQDDVAWVKQLKPTLEPKTAAVMKIAEVFVIKPGPEAGKKLL